MADGRFDRLPPPLRGTDRGEPTMREGNPRTGDMLMQMGGRMGGQGGTQQAIQLVLNAAQMLNQASQLDPNVAPVVQETLQVLQMGLQSLGSGGPGMGGPPRTPRRSRRPRRGQREEMGAEEEGASTEMGGAGI